MTRPSAEALEMITRLVEMPTVSRDSNLGLIHWIRDHLKSLGVESTLVHDETGKKANLYATLGPQDKPGIVLSGHTDVVPTDGQEWNTDPFRIVEKDGKLFGRGTSDMKSFVAIALSYAPKFLAARLDTPIHYAFTYDEEVGCLGAKKLIEVKTVSLVIGDLDRYYKATSETLPRRLRDTSETLPRHSLDTS